MEPVPETEAALQLLGTEDSYLADDMRRAGTDLTAAAPTAIGFSLGVFAEGITLTFVSSQPSLRLLDAVQYLGGGPCEDALSEGKPLEFGREDPLDEQSWVLFGRAGAAKGVLSTLSLPIIRGGNVIAGVNVYGSRQDTFRGRHQAVANVFGAWAPGAVANADLSFATRLEAAKAPGRIADVTLVEMAVGVFVARYGLAPDAARERLVQSAARAGIHVLALAKFIVDELEQQNGS
ncbi:GAF and ANTAR domain-containing protein [Terrabacter terrigena]|uniref:GAF and ANTAR domain-containing protein n=1 Tax=Terrabacter terrigena TaxID=574718 RepID=A0ABW3MWD0_9MICO